MFAYCGNAPVLHVDQAGNSMNTCQMLSDSGTNPQRVQIEKLEEYTGYSLYSTQDAAAGAVAEELWTRSKETNREYCAMVYRIDLSLHGGYGYVYYSDAILRGMHDNVFFQLIHLNHYADKMRGEQVAFVHSHPHCECHKSNDFSHGDKAVPYLVPVDSVYLIGKNHVLQRWDRDGSERHEFYAQIGENIQIVLRLFGEY